MKKPKQTRHHDKGVYIQLPFRMDRLKILMRLKGVNAKILAEVVNPGITYSSKLVYDWLEGKANPPRSKKSWERLEKIAKYLQVPMSFFFYEKVNVEMKDWVVKAEIVETGETFEFSFVTP